MAVCPESRGKYAKTYFKKIQTLSEKPKRSILSVKLFTGRTHQIRVHLQSIGHPIIGDPLYGESTKTRMHLHAQKLSFPDPDQEGYPTQTLVSPPSF